MKIEMGKKYRFNSSDGLCYGRGFRRVLAIDAEGPYPVVVELSGGAIESFTAEGLYVADYEYSQHPENNMIEIEGNENG